MAAQLQAQFQRPTKETIGGGVGHLQIVPVAKVLLDIGPRLVGIRLRVPLLTRLFG